MCSDALISYGVVGGGDLLGCTAVFVGFVYPFVTLLYCKMIDKEKKKPTHMAT